MYIHYNRSAELAEETASLARQKGVNAVVGPADLGDPRIGQQLIADATSTLGPISILVNSASGFPRDRFQSVGLDEWRDTLDLTLASPVFLTQAFASALAGDSEGAVVNVTDVKTAHGSSGMFRESPDGPTDTEICGRISTEKFAPFRPMVSPAAPANLHARLERALRFTRLYRRRQQASVGSLPLSRQSSPGPSCPSRL